MDSPESLAAALLESAAKAAVEVRGAIQKGALNVKNQARANVQQTAPVHNAHAQYAITYDTHLDGVKVSAEIGYDKDKRGGALGNLLEYGSVHNPPHRDLGRALDDEEPRFEQFVAKIAGTLL